MLKKTIYHNKKNNAMIKIINDINIAIEPYYKEFLHTNGKFLNFETYLKENYDEITDDNEDEIIDNFIFNEIPEHLIYYPMATAVIREFPQYAKNAFQSMDEYGYKTADITLQILATFLLREYIYDKLSETDA